MAGARPRVADVPRRERSLSIHIAPGGHGRRPRGHGALVKREMGGANVASSPPPVDYHDYVFRDGTLIGDFDAMYRDATEAPWRQDTRCNRWSTEVGFLMLKAQAPYGSILEIGCGLGYIAAKLKALTRQGAIDGFDLSPVAIRKARSLHPGIRFYVDDITRRSFRPQRTYDLVVMKDVAWYVLDHLNTVLQNIEACVKPQGALYLCQSFPALDRPFVGREVFPNPEAVLARMTAYTPVATALLYDYRQTDDGPLLHFLGNRR